VGIKILLADDSVTAQNMGKKILSEAGHEVITVNNGAAAAKKIAETKPELVLLDVFMPGYSGLELCEKLRNSPGTSKLPVLLTVGRMEPYSPQDGEPRKLLQQLPKKKRSKGTRKRFRRMKVVLHPRDMSRRSVLMQRKLQRCSIRRPLLPRRRPALLTRHTEARLLLSLKNFKLPVRLAAQTLPQPMVTRLCSAQNLHPKLA
jgi:CheY-like chemotaxis protein